MAGSWRALKAARQGIASLSFTDDAKKSLVELRAESVPALRQVSDKETMEKQRSPGKLLAQKYMQHIAASITLYSGAFGAYAARNSEVLSVKPISGSVSNV